MNIGCAGWTIPKEMVSRFPSLGTHLERYAQRFNAVEINSCFYRRHRLETYERWARSTPENFRFSVKFPKAITHERGLADCRLLLDEFFSDVAGLGNRLGPLLVQLPPSMRFVATVVETFLRTLRDKFFGAVVWEPRHASWFTGAGDELLARFGVGRVGADPYICPEAATPFVRGEAPWYLRLHGSPKTYYSAYDEATLHATARNLVTSARRHSSVWCIFDNTAAGAAIPNAFAVLAAAQLFRAEVP